MKGGKSGNAFNARGDERYYKSKNNTKNTKAHATTLEKTRSITRIIYALNGCGTKRRC